MTYLKDTIELQLTKLAETLAPQHKAYGVRKTDYGVILISYEHKLVFQGRYLHIEDVMEDHKQQWGYLDELHSWYKYQLPIMLAPLTVIENEKFRLHVMPLIEPDIAIKWGKVEDYLDPHDLWGDIEGHPMCTSTNLGYLDCRFEVVIYDPGALRMHCIFPEIFNEQEVANKRRALEIFTPYNEAAPPTVNDAQIKMWRRRGYDLRDIYDKAEQFAAEHGGQVVLAPNPSILIPTS